jgi:hypothetical protein
MFSDASHFNVDRSEFNNIGGDSSKTTYNVTGGTQNLNQNHGTQFGNTNIGNGQDNGGGNFAFNDGIPVTGSAQYGNQNTGSYSKNDGGIYSFGGKTPLPPTARSQPNTHHQNGIHNRRERDSDGASSEDHSVANRKDNTNPLNEREANRGRNDAPNPPVGPNVSGYYWAFWVVPPLWVLSIAFAVLAARGF